MSNDANVFKKLSNDLLLTLNLGKITKIYMRACETSWSRSRSLYILLGLTLSISMISPYLSLSPNLYLSPFSQSISLRFLFIHMYCSLLIHIFCSLSLYPYVLPLSINISRSPLSISPYLLLSLSMFCSILFSHSLWFLKAT